MAASLTQLTGGNFQDANGNVLAYGYLTLKLSQDGNVSGVGNICSGVTITIQLDVNGNVASLTSPTPVANQYVWANSNIAPINTYYKVTGYTQEGQRAFGLNNQQVAAGATFNVGTWVPNSVISWFPNPQSLTLEINGTPASSQIIQNLEAGTNITITDEGNGNIQITASGSSGPTWPGNWFSASATGFQGDELLNMNGVNLTDTNIDATATIPPTATEPIALQIQATSGANSPGLVDHSANITLGILMQWFTKCMMVGLISSRYWLGMWDGIYDPSTDLATDTPAGNLVAFRYASDVDTHIVAVCQTSSSNQTVVDTGVAPSTSTPQIFKIVPSGSSIEFFINGTLVATISTNIPATTVAMRSLFLWDNYNDIGATNGSLNFYYFWLQNAA